jgi:hypothetical protein
MPESGLSVTFFSLRETIGHYLGYGRGYDGNWTTEELQDIDEAIKSGLRRFYYPPDYEWKFLKPVTSIDLVADQGDYDLPDDFAFMDCNYMTYPSNTSLDQYVEITGEQRVRRLRRDTTNASSRPYYAAVRPKKIDPTAATNEGQRFELIFYPIPDSAYTLEYRYEVIPYSLSAADARVYPYGGAPHAETIQQACLAAAEALYNDGATQHQEQFKQMLRSSIKRDMQLGPRNLGPVTNPVVYADRSHRYPRGYREGLIVDVNGETP